MSHIKVDGLAITISSYSVHRWWYEFTGGLTTSVDVIHFRLVL